ncbi:MAG: MG2 domain-containing protein [Proteobacteria bacterium]|nr:MG2 domain-containing protein [Pseudomonadota bacterium]
MYKIILTVVITFALCVNFAFAADRAHIEMFSPEGTVKSVRQVTARFSEQIVPFGDPRLADPFDIRCVENGKGRWIDGKTWSYDFERDIPAGVMCDFTLKSGTKTLKGETVGGQNKFSFNTGGPAIRDSRPREGDTRINQDQVFLLLLDAEADESSIMKNVYCSVEGIKEQVGIKLIKGEEKDSLFKTTRFGDKAGARVALQCRQTFPSNAAVKIVWGKGVKTIGGTATTEDQTLAFKARPPFTAEFRCMREKPSAQCMPFSPMKLIFSAPVKWELAKQITLKSEKGKVWAAKTREGGDPDNVHFILFEGPFPELTAFTIHLPGNMKDDSNRPLKNQEKFPLEVRTYSYPPLAKFPSTFGVIELNEGAILPLTVRNVESEISAWMSKTVDDRGSMKSKVKESFLDKAVKAGEFMKSVLPGVAKEAADDTVHNLKGRLHRVQMNREAAVIDLMGAVERAERDKPVLKNREQSAQKFSIPKPGGTREFEVIGIPLKEAGFYVVELESEILGSRLLGRKAPMYVPAAALVTNMLAHFEWGKESSVVWVTSLDKGQPMKDASVSVHDCSGFIMWQGKTDADGIAKIDANLAATKHTVSCSGDYSRYKEGLFVFAKIDKDMTFTHSSWNQGIEPWRYNLQQADFGNADAVMAHTVFDRTLFRAGETVHMKHFIRQHTMKGISLIPEALRPDEMIIEHMGSDEKYTFALRWQSNGTSEAVWKIPANAKLGTYNVILSKREGQADGKQEKTRGHRRRYGRQGPNKSWNSGSFRIEAFRIPLAKGIIQGPKEPLVNAKAAEIDVSVSYLSGGGASNLPVKVRTEIQRHPILLPDYEGFIFANGPVKEGIQKAVRFDDSDEDDQPPEDGTAQEKKVKQQTLDVTLDRTGTARAKLLELPSVDVPKDILTELEFMDPNGEVQTVSAKIPLYPSRLFVGIEANYNAVTTQEDMLKYKVIAIDLKGNPVPGAPITVNIFERKNYSHRRRVTGGFYAYENLTEIKKIGAHCSGKTDSKGILTCEGKPPMKGTIILQAETTDNAGNLSAVHYDMWIAGKHDDWFEARNDDRMDLIPDKKQYEAGETAKFQVKMPFQTGTALVTVEREGVMDVFVRKLSRKNPVIEVPVKRNYSPNIFVSALVVRGRVAGTKPTAFFDPGKPAYKLGISEIKVGWKPHELKVKVAPSKKIYKVREEVNAKITVLTAYGNAPPKGSEVTVAVVDEGLLELKPNDSWKLLEAMMGRRPYEVQTSTAQMMVVGKRHFGRKALPHGGGGGRHLTRELFDSLVYWKATVVLNEKGEASISFPLNDSLTSFRIVAVANGGSTGTGGGGSGLFGAGSESIRTTQDLSIFSGIPPLVREGDKFTAGTTVRNTSLRDMVVEATMSVYDGKEKKEMQPVKETIKAGEAKEFKWGITVPYGPEKLEYETAAKEAGGNAYDRIKVSQKVIKAIPVRTFQATLTQVKDVFQVTVEKPDDAVPGRGGVNLLLRPKLSEGLNGVREYMKEYPYTCLEQKTSRAVALRDKEAWAGITAELPAYLDSDGLAKFFPLMLYGSDILTSYMLSVSHESGYAIPDDLRERMTEGLKGFVEGRVIRWSSLPTADLSIRKMAAVEALSRYGLADSKLLASITIEPNLWPTSAVLDWTNVLMRTGDIPDQKRKLKEAVQILRSRLNLQGTTMGFSTEDKDNLWWLMTTPDLNAAKILLTAIALDDWKEDIPRVARGSLGRMKKGHWDTTLANAWGVLATEKFSKIYESVPVTGTTIATLGKQTEVTDWGKSQRGRADISFAWPKGRETLNVTQKGTGAPWATVRSMAAIPLKEPFSSGYRIKKTLTAVDRKDKGVWSRGDVVRVNLEIEAQSDMTWVVVSDPIPAGSMILGSGLGRDSAILTGSEAGRMGRTWEAFRERTFEALRVYYEFVPKGKWTVEYTLRLNNEGLFQLPETRVEALYSPEMFGEIPNKRVEIKP